MQKENKYPDSTVFLQPAVFLRSSTGWTQCQVWAHILQKGQFLRKKRRGRRVKKGIRGAKRKDICPVSHSYREKEVELEPCGKAVKPMFWFCCQFFRTKSGHHPADHDTMSSWGLHGTLIFRLLTGIPAVIRSSLYYKCSVWNSVL